MTDLKFAKFASNSRIRRAAENAPAMKPGEPDRAAVTILQEALIQAGFPIRDGATGLYGPQTSAAVREVERKFGLGLDTGFAGHQVLAKLDALLTSRPSPTFVRGADLQLLLQQTNTLGGFTHRSYFTKAESLLDEFGLSLKTVDRRSSEFEVPGGTIDPQVQSDIDRVRALAEKHTPGITRAVLRIIFCRFDGGGLFALTDGGFQADIVLIDVGRRNPDNCTLIHEMIHATGLTAHDLDKSSVFAEGSARTTLRPEHAVRLSKATFARAL